MKIKKLIRGILLTAALAGLSTCDRNHIDFRAEQLAAASLFEKPKDTDWGLYLYRNDLTRSLVAAFYADITNQSEIAEVILKYADSNNIPLPLAFALAWGESRFRVDAFNRNARSVDRGLFQLNSRSFPALKKKDFYDPEINARYGLAHLRYCLNEGRSELVALAMYNAGTQGVRTGTPYSTLTYVAEVLEQRKQFEELFERYLDPIQAVQAHPLPAGDS